MEKIEDLEHAIGDLEQVIYTLEKYNKEYSDIVDVLEEQKAILEIELENEEADFEEVCKEWEEEKRYEEMEYWRDVL